MAKRSAEERVLEMFDDEDKEGLITFLFEECGELESDDLDDLSLQDLLDRIADTYFREDLLHLHSECRDLGENDPMHSDESLDEFMDHEDFEPN